MRQEIKVAPGHLAKNGNLQHTQTRATRKALSDSSRKTKSAKAMRDAPLPVLNWVNHG